MGDPIPTAPDYGLDAPGVVQNLTIGGIACFVAGTVLSVVARPVGSLLSYGLLAWGLLAGASMCVVAFLMTRSSRRGKLMERDALLDSLGLAGNEVVLDLGCGRGLLAVGAAKRLPTGRVIAVDLWNPKDQKGANH
jgi:hypothetical protein